MGKKMSLAALVGVTVALFAGTITPSGIKLSILSRILSTLNMHNCVCHGGCLVSWASTKVCVVPCFP